MTPPRLVVVGTGPVARALASTHAARGGCVAAVVSRSAESAAALARSVGADVALTDPAASPACDAVLVAVADGALGETGARLADAVHLRGRPCLHTSGALAGDALGPGVLAGSLHPLQSFPRDARDADLVARVAGTHFFHEGAGEDDATALVGLWQGTLHRLAPGGKVLYHAGAATLSNHAVALFDAATRLFALAGVSRDESRSALASLLAGTAANLDTVGVPAALTGPIARGDAATVARHLAALRASAPELVESYLAMARRTLAVAREKGLSAVAADALERLLAGR